jgi:signal transduction histidine kinase/PleD family two-component response regulator
LPTFLALCPSFQKEFSVKIQAMTPEEFNSAANPVRILVVDDHPNTATTLARALAQLGTGVNVISASSGLDALEKVKTTGVDILFTDMIMPEMTGLELIEKMQKHPAGRPSYTYLVTAYDVPGLNVTAHRLKVNEVIVKPVRPERICQIATNAIEEMKQFAHSPKTITVGMKKFKILVADDKADNITLLTRYLEYEGYEHVVAFDGLEALDKVRYELPDLVLLDINMPHKDGFTVLEEIRADAAVAHIPVIILTAARLDPADVQSGLNLGADDYVTKPFDRHELMARIRTKLRVKKAEDNIRRRNRELSLLPEIGKELSARTDINELLTILLRRSVETLGAISGYILIINPDNTQLKKSFSTSEIDIEFPKLDEFFGIIAESHQGLIISDTRRDERWQAGQMNLFHSAVIVPMFGRNTLLGLLVLVHEQAEYFESEHLLLLQAIASQAAIAIENARLYSNIAHEQKKLATVLQHATEAILMLDAEGRLILINPAGEKLFTDYEAKLGKPLARVSGYDTLIKLLDEALESDKPRSGEVVWPDQRTFSVLISPIEEGGCVIILHDVTQFKTLERVKNEFISIASHDLKNPISIIIGFSDLLLKAGPLNDAQREFVKQIHSTSENMNELVQNLLQFAKIDMGGVLKKESLDVNSLLAEIKEEFQPQAEAKKQTLQFMNGEEHLKILGDSVQLKQALRNLVGNAIKFTAKNGSIHLSVEKGMDEVLIHIKDSGYGIPADDLPFIFDRFYRVRSEDVKGIEGNGLGLAIVKSIVEQNGGHVSVLSEPGKGSCFSFNLPLMQQEKPTVLHSKVKI